MTQSTEITYRVVISDEERYSIWPEYKEIPWGWRAEGKLGTKQECLDHIGEVWTDMRPLSLLKAMAASQQANA
ncbi:MAG: MbtH family NRPS accessory protein [Cyanobacteria bacterium P01_D01_bin.56]